MSSNVFCTLVFMTRFCIIHMIPMCCLSHAEVMLNAYSLFYALFITYCCDVYNISLSCFREAETDFVASMVTQHDQAITNLISDIQGLKELTGQL